MSESAPKGVEPIQLRSFNFTLTHEDAVCQMYMERKVNWTITKTYQAVDRQKAKALAENDRVIGVCNHVYSYKPRRRK